MDSVASRILAGVLLIVCLPLILLTTLLCVSLQGRPVLFTQARAGKAAHPFTTIKFRSMVTDLPPPLTVGPVAFTGTYVTPLGGWLRRLRLDELPQLVNVLRGDMAIVGPRPCLVEQVSTFQELERIRFQVLPGLTGLAEVCGNVLLTTEEQRALDTYYVRHRSIRLDGQVLLRTLVVVIRGPRRDEAWIERAMRARVL
jgi:lipopolysaccharide/colanic/teichoic acid biosynthesis glycosyltransferase